jgi:RNA polymerase sigma factor (sigma-70 family)
MYRVLDDMHAPRPRGRPLGYIYHPSFDDPSQEAAILAPMPGAEDYEAQRRQMKAPEGVPPELAPLYTPLLSKEQERHLFRKMNFLLHQAARLRGPLRLPGGRIDAGESRPQSLGAIDNLERQARAVKALLVNCNMRLVVSLAKRYATRTDNFSELLSDGNVSLISAVEKFDYGRGNKFSTYASRAIMKHYARSIVKEKHRRRRYPTGHGWSFFEAAVDTRSDEKDCLAAAEQAGACVNRLLQLLEFLDPRERQIIRLRLGLDGYARRMTLEDVGKQLGVTKERVRQLQERAMKKLRNLAAANRVELP